MKLAVVCLSCAALPGSVVYGQSAKTPAGFELADVHVSPIVRNPYMRGPFHWAARYELRQATMVDLIATAYEVEREKVLDGPNWLEMDHFDIIAKAPAGAKKDDLNGLLQGLLASRFHLAVHKDTRPMRAFSLTAGKKPLLKKSAGTGSAGCQISIPPPPPGLGGRPDAPMMQYVCRNVTMAMFAQELRSSATAQVIDQAGLEGAWDFDLKTPLQALIIPGAESAAMVEALDKQLGLKLAAVTLPMEVMVVDSVNRKPADNSAEALAFVKATAPPAEFEVADIKLSAPPAGGRGRGMRFQPGGRITITGMTLGNMIVQAWNLTPEMLVGAPKWIDDDRYDVVAKAPSATAENEAPSDAGPAGGGGGPNIDTDTVWVMMRALLAERFKLRVHEEAQAIPAYTLLAVKPKLKRADPASRTRFSEGPGSDGKDPRNANPMNGRLVTAQNVTMAQFAARLQSIAGGYIRAPVLDATGLEGAYDFTLNFSPAGMVGMGLAGGRGGRGGGDAANPNDSPTASDPTGAISLPEAIEKQLGLKLELQKRPIQVLVIDRVERTATEN